MRVGQPSDERRVFQGETSRVKGLEREPRLASPGNLDWQVLLQEEEGEELGQGGRSFQFTWGWKRLDNFERVT